MIDLSGVSTYHLEFLASDSYVSDEKREAAREELDRRKLEAQTNY